MVSRTKFIQKSNPIKLLNSNDTRTILETAGCACLFASEALVTVRPGVKKKITACAFRNGSGGISNTICHQIANF